MTPANSSPRAEYQKRMHQRQTVVFGTIAAVMAFLLIVCTLFWLGVVPFPIKKGFSVDPKSVVLIPCADDSAAPVDPASITVRVYNSGDTDGLAGEVAESLKSGGINVSETNNWGGDSINESVEILTAKDAISEAYTLRAFLPNAKIIYDSTLADGQVDVVIGVNWDTTKDLVVAPTKDDFSAAMASLDNCTPKSDLP